MSFDPDKYLEKKKDSGSFDPDAYLKKKDKTEPYSSVSQEPVEQPTQPSSKVGETREIKEGDPEYVQVTDLSKFSKFIPKSTTGLPEQEGLSDRPTEGTESTGYSEEGEAANQARLEAIEAEKTQVEQTKALGESLSEYSLEEMNTRTVDAKTQLDNQKKINETYYKENYEPLKAEYDNFILKGKESGLITENEKGQFVVDDSIFPQLEEYEAALNESQSEMSAISELIADDLKDYQDRVNEEYARKSVEGGAGGAMWNSLVKGGEEITKGLTRTALQVGLSGKVPTETAMLAVNKWMDLKGAPAIESGGDVLKVESTTDEYIQEAKKGGLLNEAGLALAESTPAMAATFINPTAGYISMYGQGAEATYQAIKDNENLTETEKAAYSAVSGVVAASLEKAGIDIAVGNNKLVNAVTQKYLRYTIENGKKVTLANAARFAAQMGVKGVGEGATEAVQEAADWGQRELTNLVKGSEVLEIEDYQKELDKIGHSFVVGAIAGTMMSSGIALAQNVANGTDELDPTVFKLGEEQAKRPDFIPSLKANLAAKVESGEITKEKAEEYMNEAQKAVDAVSKVDEDLPIAKRQKATELIIEKGNIDASIEGKEAVSPEKTKRKEEIENELKDISNPLDQATDAELEERSKGESKAKQEQTKGDIALEQESAERAIGEEQAKLEAEKERAERGELEQAVGELEMEIESMSDASVDQGGFEQAVFDGIGHIDPDQALGETVSPKGSIGRKGDINPSWIAKEGSKTKSEKQTIDQAVLAAKERFEQDSDGESTFDEAEARNLIIEFLKSPRKEVKERFYGNKELVAKRADLRRAKAELKEFDKQKKAETKTKQTDPVVESVKGKKERRFAKRSREYADTKGVKIDKKASDFYTPQKQAEIKGQMDSMSNEQLYDMYSDKKIESSNKVYYGVELLKRKLDKGEDVTEIRDGLKKLGTTTAQTLAAYATLKTATPEGLVSIVMDAVESKGRKIKTEKGKVVVDKSFKDLSKDVAKAVRKAKFTRTMKDLANLKSDPTGLFKGAWDGTVETFATTIELTGDLTEALGKAVDYIKSTDWYKQLSDKGKKDAERIVKNKLKEEAIKDSRELKDLQKIKESIPNESQQEKLYNISKKLIDSQRKYTNLGLEAMEGKPMNEAEIKEAEQELSNAAREMDRFVGDMILPTWGAKLGMTIQGSLLTVKSLVKNPVYNLFRLLGTVPAEMAGELPLMANDAFNKLVLGKDVNRKKLYSTKAYIYALTHGAPKGIKEAWDKAVKGKNVVGTDYEQTINQGFMPLRAWLGVLTNTKLGDALGVKRDQMAVDENGKIKTGDRIKKLYDGTLGIAPEVMFRMLPFGDTPFYRLIQTKELYLEAEHRGLKGMEFENFMKFPPADVLETVNEEASKAVFQEDSKVSKWAQKQIKSLETKTPHQAFDNATEFIVRTQFPYVKTPVNVVNQTIDFALPSVSFIKSAYYYSQKDYRKAAEFFGKAAVGNMMILAAEQLISNGLVVGALYGAGDSDEGRERGMAYTTQPPNTINLSGLERAKKGEDPTWKPTDNVMDYRTLGFLGTIIGMHANDSASRDRLKAKGKRRNVIGDNKSYDSDVTTRFSNFHSMASYALEQSFLAGTNALLGALKGGEKEFESWLKQTFKASSTIALPNTLSQLNKARAEYMPNLRDDSEWFKIPAINKSVPKSYKNIILDRTFQTDGLPLKYDITGHPIKNTPKGKNPYLHNLIDPWAVRETESTSVMKEMFDVFGETEDIRGVIQNPKQTFSYNKENFKMDTETYANFQKEKQQYMMKELEELFSKSSYKKKTPEQKTVLIQKKMSQVNRSSFVRKLKKETAKTLKEKEKKKK